MVGPSRLHAVASGFALPGPVIGTGPLEGGLINSSWQVSCGGPAGSQRFVLQRVNPAVFPDPDALMANILAVTGHLRRAQPVGIVLEFVPLQGATDRFLLRDGGGGAWRMCRFVEGTRSHTAVTCPSHGEAAARAYGRFLRLLADFPAADLHEVLPGFHATEARYARLLSLAPTGGDALAEVEGELAALARHRDLATILDPALPERVIHGDTKLSNVLLDAGSGAAVCVVDLDTVMAGPVAWDFGDMVRSMACTQGEEHTDLDAVALDRDRFGALARGYLQETAPLLTAEERRSLIPGALAITFEQAVRYLTDHLEGDRYYRIRYPGQNLTRCRNQLRLLASLAAQRRDLEAMVP